jgi:hypothetical protein
MNQHATPVWHKGCGNKGQKTKGPRNMMTVTSEERISSRIFRITKELEIKKLTVRSSTGLCEVNYWILCRQCPFCNQRRDVQSTDL